MIRGSQIHESEKYKISNDVKEHHDRTILMIKNVNTQDLDTYQCIVEVKTQNYIQIHPK